MSRERRELAEWTEMVTHDLAQPINAIILNADLLLRGALGATERTQAERVRTTARRLGRMIADLTDASLADAGRVELLPEVLDLASWIPATFARLGGDAARLPVIVPSSPLHVRADAARLEQVLAALLTLAARSGAELVFELRDDGDMTLTGGLRPKGLGQIVARSLIEAQGGKFAVERASGGGGRVRFSLPRAEPGG